MKRFTKQTYSTLLTHERNEQEARYNILKQWTKWNHKWGPKHDVKDMSAPISESEEFLWKKE